MVTLSVTLKADLDDDGVFESDWSSYLLGLRTGLRRDAALDAYGARTAQFEMDNADSRFSPRNTDSPYYPNLVDGTRIQLAAQVTLGAGKNYLLNPSVETDLTNWSLLGNADPLARVATDARYGAYSCKVTNGLAGNFGARIVSPGSGPAGSTNYFAFSWVKGVAGGNLRLKARATGGSGASGETEANTTLTGEWQRVITSISNPDGSHTQFEVDVEHTSAALGDVLYIDGAAVDVWPNNVYVDGDQPAASWDGTPHASTSQRAANPAFTLFTGELRDFRVDRHDALGRATLEATGIRETLSRLNLSAGPFQRERADLMVRRLLDIAESRVAERLIPASGGTDPHGEAVIDGARRYDGDSAGFTLVTGTSLLTQQDMRNTIETDSWDALESDNVIEGRPQSSTPWGLEWTYDVKARVLASRDYRFSLFVAASHKDMGGETARLRVKVDGSFVGGSATVTLDRNDRQAGDGSQPWHSARPRWKYLELIVPLGTVATSVEMYVDVSGIGASSHYVWFDGLHVAPAFSDRGLLGSPSFPSSVVTPAFPTEEGSIVSVNDTASQSQTASLPANIVAGETLLMFLRGLLEKPPSGWTQLIGNSAFVGPGGVGHLTVIFRVADGTEGATVALRFASSTVLAATAHRISGAEKLYIHWPEAPSMSQTTSTYPVVNGSSGLPDPPSLTPIEGARNYLIYAVGVSDVAISAAPSGYSGYVRADGTSGDLAAAYKQVNAATENPGTFSGTSGNWLGTTVALYPRQDSLYLQHLEYVDAYEEDAAPVLEDVAKSVGGWFYDARDGSLTFEAFTHRESGVTAKMRLSDAPDGGLPFVISSYQQPTTSLAETVRATGGGDVALIPAEGGKSVVGSLEATGTTSIDANEERVFPTRHSSSIARVPSLRIVGDTFDTERVESYGQASDVTLIAGAAGGDVDGLAVLAQYVLSRRPSQRSEVSVGEGPTGLPVEPVLDVEMPAQRDNYLAPYDLATWARTKYNAGPATLVARIEGVSKLRLIEMLDRDVGVPVWVHHQTGPGHFGLGALFYCEGTMLTWQKGAPMTLELTLEEAT